MRVILCLIFVINITACNIHTSSDQKFENESDSVIYSFVNSFVKIDGIGKTPKTPSRFYYSYKECGMCDSSLNYVDIFIERIKEKLENDTILKTNDYTSFKKQIANPSVIIWNKNYMKIRITDEATLWNNSHSISVPLFSVDKRKAIIFGNYWGMSRAFLYKYNESNKTWEYYIEIWQDGS
jgi:hypothetical protein